MFISRSRPCGLFRFKAILTIFSVFLQFYALSLVIKHMDILASPPFQHVHISSPDFPFSDVGSIIKSVYVYPIYIPLLVQEGESSNRS
jgi:hypothetical protein